MPSLHQELPADIKHFHQSSCLIAGHRVTNGIREELYAHVFKVPIRIGGKINSIINNLKQNKYI